MNDVPRIEYVEARRVLLDVLSALREQLDAVVLVGAQAVYLRTAGRLPTYQPFTTRCRHRRRPESADRTTRDRCHDDRSGLRPHRRTRDLGGQVQQTGIDDDIVVPIDLIVPMEIATWPCRRSARLAGEHGKHSARKSEGLEGALVDHGPVEITAIDPTDSRSIVVNVAVKPAMLVAKLHKLGDRLEKPERLDARMPATCTGCSM